MRTQQISDYRGTWLFLLCITLLLNALLVFSSGCGSKDEGSEEPTEEADVATEYPAVPREYFAGWQKYSSQAFELRYPPIEELEQRIDGIANKCDTIARFVAMYVNVQPSNKMYMMVFPNRFEAEELLGREVPCVSGDTIFYDIFSPLGIGVTKLMMKYAAPEGSKFDFVNEGLPRLLDFSGEDYHERAMEILNSGDTVSAAQLADNAEYSRLPRETRKDLAASFIGFLSYNYGPRPIYGLIREDLTARGILMLTIKKGIDALDMEWKRDLPRLASLDALETQP